MIQDESHEFQNRRMMNRPTDGDHADLVKRVNEAAAEYHEHPSNETFLAWYNASRLLDIVRDARHE